MRSAASVRVRGTLLRVLLVALTVATAGAVLYGLYEFAVYTTAADERGDSR